MSHAHAHAYDHHCHCHCASCLMCLMLDGMGKALQERSVGAKAKPEGWAREGLILDGKREVVTRHLGPGLAVAVAGSQWQRRPH